MGACAACGLATQPDVMSFLLGLEILYALFRVARLAAVEGTYDIIMVDAYRDITIPFQMSSIEFFRLVREHLAPGGVLVMNMNMYSEEEGSITDYLSDTVAAVFPYVYTADVPWTTNRELFA